MSLLDVVKEVSLDVGVYGQTGVVAFVGNSDRASLELKSFINSAGEEIARRVDWGVLRKSTTLTGTGAKTTFNLPADYSRLSKGLSVTVNGVAIRGGLSFDEWNSLTFTQGTPRFMRLVGKTIEFWPYLANGATVIVSYQSLYWNGSSAQIQSDADTPLIPETVLKKATIARWRRQKGMSYESAAAEYEQVLMDFAEFDTMERSP